jgi:hypothetical protein
MKDNNNIKEHLNNCIKSQLRNGNNGFWLNLFEKKLKKIKKNDNTLHLRRNKRHQSHRSC